MRRRLFICFPSKKQEEPDYLEEENDYADDFTQMFVPNDYE